MSNQEQEVSVHHRINLEWGEWGEWGQDRV